MTSVETPREQVGPAEPTPAAVIDGHAQGILSTSGLLLVRRLIATLGAAVATAVTARQLSTESFGVYSAALATFFLAQAFSDLGFASVVARELATRPDERPALLRAGLRPAVTWSLLIAVAFGIFALLSSDSVRLISLLIFVPALAVTGLAVARQWFIVGYDVRRMAAVDTACNLGQVAALIVVSSLGGGPVGLAVVVAASTIVNTLIVVVGALRRAGPAAVRVAESRTIVIMALPIGIPSLLASAYFSLDLVLAGYLISAEQVAQYAAAVKLLTLVTVLPSLLMSVALPGLSAVRESSTPQALGELVARVWHLLAALGLPVCVGLACFAPLATSTFFGDRYLEAADPLRVLMAAGVMALLGNVFGILLIASRRSLATLVPNVIALAANVGFNIVLLPRVGIMAAAWLTLATEVFIVSCSLLLLRRTLRWGPFLRVSWRPVLAAAAAAGVSFLPVGDLLRLGGSVVVFLGLLTLLRGWPLDLQLALRRVTRSRTARGTA